MAEVLGICATICIAFLTSVSVASTLDNGTYISVGGDGYGL